VAVDGTKTEWREGRRKWTERGSVSRNSDGRHFSGQRRWKGKYRNKKVFVSIATIKPVMINRSAT
jgi:hypothetical protein